MRILLVLAAAFLLTACAALSSLNQLGQDYCQQATPAQREIMAAQLNSRLDGFQVQILCDDGQP